MLRTPKMNVTNVTNITNVMNVTITKRTNKTWNNYLNSHVRILFNTEINSQNPMGALVYSPFEFSEYDEYTECTD